MLCQRDLLAGEFQVRMEFARAQIPILVCDKVINFVLSPADVASSF